MTKVIPLLLIMAACSSPVHAPEAYTVPDYVVPEAAPTCTTCHIGYDGPTSHPQDDVLTCVTCHEVCGAQPVACQTCHTDR